MNSKFVVIVALGVCFGCSIVLGPNFARAQTAASSVAADVTAPQVDDPSAQKANLTDLSLEELMSISVEVHSASKKAERLSDAPAAIFVLTREDIRRGGFSSLSEALRMVPGLYVAKINQRWWTISARGFSDYLNNKMLVLLDGRSLYSPEFGGVYWDTLEPPLEHVERVEIIRGPGGTLWGANAINGVINITTRNSRDTQGLSVVTSGGIDEGYVGSVRFGGHVGDKLTYRVFGKTNYWYPGTGTQNAPAYDTARLAQGGTRLDWKLSSKDGLTIEGGGYQEEYQNLFMAYTSPTSGRVAIRDEATFHGGHFLSRWSHTFSPRSTTEVLGYCDWTDRISYGTEARNTCSAEFQHNLNIRERHSLIWGGGVWHTLSHPYSSFGTNFPGRKNNIVLSSFAQYELAVAPKRLRLIAGSKFEHNLYTGFEIQPQIRGVWTPSKAHTVWGAMSRAVRTPDLLEWSELTELSQLPSPVPTFLTVVGNTELKSEVLRAYEIGYRLDPTPKFSLDAAIFYNHYGRLINVNLVNPLSVAGPPVLHSNPTYVDIPVPWQNLGSGQTHGAEVYVKVRPINRWMLATGVTELRGNSVNLNDTLNLPVANTSKHQFNIQSRLNLTPRLELDSALYHYNGIPGYNFFGSTVQDVPTHNRVDLGMSFRRLGGFTLSVWARDLTAAPHWEDRPYLFSTTGSQMGRTVAFKVMWQSAPED